MPVLQWGMLCVLSLLLSIGFLSSLWYTLLTGPARPSTKERGMSMENNTFIYQDIENFIVNATSKNPDKNAPCTVQEFNNAIMLIAKLLETVATQN